MIERSLDETPPPSFRRRFLLGLLAAATFTAVALWCLRSVVGQWHTAYVGSGELEGWLWRYWWMKRLIVDAWRHTSAHYTAYVALVSGSYPETGNVFDLQVLSMPLDALLGAPDYYNVKAVLVLVLDGLAGYWLARAVVGDWAASVLCGFAFAFGSYVLLEIDTGRIRQAVTFPLALYALTLVRMTVVDGDLWPALRRALWAGLAFGLCSTVFLFYGMSAAFLTVVWLCWLGTPDGPQRGPYVVIVVVAVLGVLQCMAAQLPYPAVLAVMATALVALVGWVGWRDGRRRLAQLSVLAAIGVLASMPYATWYLEQAVVRHQPLPEVTWHRPFPPLDVLVNPDANVHTSDNALLNSMQRFRGDSVSWDFPFRCDYRRAVPLGLTVLVLAGLFLGRRPWLWLLVLMAGYTLSLGPFLKGGPMEAYLRAPDGVRLPQAYFFQYVPFFSRLFSPIRMEGLFLLGYGVTASWTCAALFRRFGLATPWRVLVVAALIGLSLFQMGRDNTIPLSYTRLQVPDVYPWIAQEKGDGVIEIPLREGDYANYYQIFHGKRVLEGWACRSLPEGFPASATAWLANVPDRIEDGNSFLRWLRAANEGDSSPLKTFDPRDLVKLSSLGYRWALLHERGCCIVKGPDGPALFQYMRHQLDSLLGAPVRTSTERVRERWGDNRVADEDGLYTYSIVVYDLQNVNQPPAASHQLR